MPQRPARICACGHRVPGDELCACQVAAEKARRARAEATRPSARERGYSVAWQKARAGFLAKHPICARPGCGAAATVIHHTTPHRGDKALFWNRRLWQPVCKPCHDGPCQAEEKQSLRGANDALTADLLPLLSGDQPLIDGIENGQALLAEADGSFTVIQALRPNPGQSLQEVMLVEGKPSDVHVQSPLREQDDCTRICGCRSPLLPLAQSLVRT